MHREKITDTVDFPIRGLDISRFVLGEIGNPEEGNPYIYDLYAVSEHGGGLGGGHYTASCKSPSDGKWYNFNDSSVTCLRTSASSDEGNDDVLKQQIVSPEAYVLFYRRRLVFMLLII